MALNLNKLAALSYADGFTDWRYVSSSDSLATIMAAGYFTGDALNMMRAGDRLFVQASDGWWEDVVWSNDGSTIQIGIASDRVEDSLDGAAFALGYRRRRFDGAEFVYLEADAAVAAKDAVILHADNGSQPITTALAAVDAGMGKKVAVGPQTPSQAVATGDFYWGCVLAPASAGIEVNLAAAADDYENLQTTTTAGKLDDTAVAATSYIAGLVIITAAGGAEAEIAEISYPYVADYPQGS